MNSSRARLSQRRTVRGDDGLWAALDTLDGVFARCFEAAVAIGSRADRLEIGINTLLSPHGLELVGALPWESPDGEADDHRLDLGDSGVYKGEEAFGSSRDDSDIDQCDRDSGEGEAWGHDGIGAGASTNALAAHVEDWGRAFDSASATAAALDGERDDLRCAVDALQAQVKRDSEALRLAEHVVSAALSPCCRCFFFNFFFFDPLPCFDLLLLLHWASRTQPTCRRWKYQCWKRWALCGEKPSLLRCKWQQQMPWFTGKLILFSITPALLAEW